MKSIFAKAVFVAIFCSLSACGGGGGSSGTGTTTATLSADQSIFESEFLSPALSYGPNWSLPNTGTPVSGTNYLYSHPSSISASPLTAGPQTIVNGANASLASTLAIPTGGVNRYLVGGQIISDSSSIQKFSYSGTGIETDLFASDGTTLLTSGLRTGFQQVTLSGLVTASPATFAHNFNSLFFNSSLLNTSATWSAGSTYFQFLETNLATKYTVFDASSPATTGTTPTPIATGTTIAALMTAGGIVSNSDGVTYTLSNGSMSIVNGVNTYTATARRPNTTGTRYRTYYEIGGNVLTGDLTNAGDTLGGNTFDVTVGGVTTRDYSSTVQIRLNKLANDSLKAALTF